MSTIIVQRLNERVRATLVEHFLGLSARDRHLRFGIPLAQPGIAAYVDRIDLDRDAVIVFQDEEQGVAGVAHVAIVDDWAEVGLSVLETHRGFGLGAALFQLAVMQVRKRRVPQLFMRFLTDNTPVMRIARRFGMDVVSRAGESDACLKLNPVVRGDGGKARNECFRAA